MILSDEELLRCEQVAVEAARKAGEVDLVTETDKACEALIFEAIQTAFPTHKFIGEEGSSLTGTADLSEDATWMVDPLDGTTNFVHMFPFVCVSIGLVVNKEVVMGVVYNPILKEMFTARRGEGAFRNGSRIRASEQTDLGKALVATEVGTARDKATVDATTGRINALMYKVRSLRLSGSCAMNLVGIACGRLDAFYEIGFGGPWDVAAGAIILLESGGRIFDPDGGRFDIMSRRVGASNGHLQQALVDALASATNK